jgi:hypothetical protein
VGRPEEEMVAVKGSGGAEIPCPLSHSLFTCIWSSATQTEKLLSSLLSLLSWVRSVALPVAVVAAAVHRELFSDRCSHSCCVAIEKAQSIVHLMVGRNYQAAS